MSRLPASESQRKELLEASTLALYFVADLHLVSPKQQHMKQIVEDKLRDAVVKSLA